MSEYEKGYREQSDWLRGKSIPSAQNALESRLATVGDDDGYNGGGNQATRDYIERMMTLAIRAQAITAERKAAGR